MARARAEALERLTAAQEEAEDLLHQAGREADSMVSAAREDNRRLERRMEQLRAAVTEFEAHLTNLAQVAGDRAHLITDMIDQEIESKPPAKRADSSAVGPAPQRAVRPGGDEEPGGGPQEDMAEPDGSGQLPVKRPTVVTQSIPGTDTGIPDEVDLRADLEEQFVYDGAAAGSGQATATIYQRRGNGIKERVSAIETPDDEDPD